MTVEQMRSAIANAPRYGGAKGWVNKVQNFRPNQVIAVYHSFEKNGYFDPPVKLPEAKIGPMIGVQLNMFDILKGDRNEPQS